jgi:molybdopterin-guanine dinucleotide biosynthesis protein
MDRIKKSMDTEHIKVLTGVRRSGKTFVLKQVREELRNRGILENQIIPQRRRPHPAGNNGNDPGFGNFLKASGRIPKIKHYKRCVRCNNVARTF